MGRMKWWGGGDEALSFTHHGKPALGPFLERHLAIDVQRPASRPVAFEQVDIPDPALPADLRLALSSLRPRTSRSARSSSTTTWRSRTPRTRSDAVAWPATSS
jgi:hypothetical protein